MSHADLTLDAWLALTDEAATRTAGAICRETGCRLAGVAPHTYAGRAGRVAFLERDGVRFALVPGGTVTLGFDAGRFVPTARQAADFAAAADEWDLLGPPAEFVAQVTSPVRRATLPARLVAVRSAPAADAEDHAGVLAGLARGGLRPPTPDEWEHACGAGAETLFRWGDDYPEGEPYGDVPLLREPNRFGLVIGDDPYRAEFTTDPAVLCGGDGGSALCGGAGDFLSWLTLATSYRDPQLAETVEKGGLTDETPVRPVIAL